MNHIISSEQFSKKFIENLFIKTDNLYNKPIFNKTLKDITVSLLFYQPSTRTYSSFSSAAQKLGANVISINSDTSSVVKGETLEDTIKTLNQYSDCIVLRHHIKGSAKIASEISDKPIINAGDGVGEHPTQALLDLYTIISKKNIDNIHVGFVGDIKHSRTIHSLVKLLTLFNVKMSFVSPKELSYSEFAKIYSIDEYDDVNSIIKDVDVLYITRVQKEYLVGKTEFNYEINSSVMSLAKKDMILMHPFPRVNEIAKELDLDKRSVYFEQIKNGLYVRAALLDTVIAKLV